MSTLPHTLPCLLLAGGELIHRDDWTAFLDGKQDRREFRDLGLLADESNHEVPIRARHHHLLVLLPLHRVPHDCKDLREVLGQCPLRLLSREDPNQVSHLRKREWDRVSELDGHVHVLELLRQVLPGCIDLPVFVPKIPGLNPLKQGVTDTREPTRRHGYCSLTPGFKAGLDRKSTRLNSSHL